METEKRRVNRTVVLSNIKAQILLKESNFLLLCSRRPKAIILIPKPQSQLILHLTILTVMEKRLQEAQLFKEEGNQRYREGKYRDAVSRYHRALLQLRGLDPSLPSPIPSLGPEGPALTPEQENILHTTQTDCYNNLAGKSRAGGWVEEHQDLTIRQSRGYTRL